MHLMHAPRRLHTTTMPRTDILATLGAGAAAARVRAPCVQVNAAGERVRA